MNPAVIYDIGANDGGWTRDAKNVFPSARYEQFEANSHHAAHGRHIVLLAEEEKDVTFYKSIRDTPNTGASMYLEVSQHYTPGLYTTETMHAVPLDTYVATHALPPPQFLKLDVQGAELDVLKGAAHVLETTKYVLMEVALHRWNKGAPMIEEVMAFMHEHGYCMIDIVDTHFVANYLFQIDVLFAHASTGLRREEFFGH